MEFDSSRGCKHQALGRFAEYIRLMFPLP